MVRFLALFVAELEKRDVHLLVRADDLGPELSLLDERDQHFGGVRDGVVVREYETGVITVAMDDETGAERGLFTLLIC